MSDPRVIQQALAAPFALEDLSWKPQSVKGSRALAVVFVTARTVQDRLDRAVGVGGWQDAYERLPDGSVVCRLSLKLGGEWVSKVDAGSPSEQPDEGDRTKAAFSDALKRAAVKFGVARYLHRLPPIWCDYDPAKKQIRGTPPLPEWALPPGPPAAQAPAPPPLMLTMAERFSILDVLMKAKRRTWLAALRHFHVATPDDFKEPESPEAIAALATFVPASVLEQMEQAFERAKKRTRQAAK